MSSDHISGQARKIIAYLKSKPKLRQKSSFEIVEILMSRGLYSRKTTKRDAILSVEKYLELIDDGFFFKRSA